MIKYFLPILFFCACRPQDKHTPKQCNCWDDTAFHSQGITYVRKDSSETSPPQNGLINPLNERVIKDTFIDWGDGSQPGMYWQVEYDCGRPAPDDWQIIRWVLGDSVPKCFNEWQIELKDVANSGPQESKYLWDHQLISFYCPNHRSKLQKYSADIYISESKVEVVQNKDTLKKYLKIEYPYPDNPIRSRREKNNGIKR
jgi:hypothetical protein